MPCRGPVLHWPPGDNGRWWGGVGSAQVTMANCHQIRVQSCQRQHPLANFYRGPSSRVILDTIVTWRAVLTVLLL